jgi:hypothetical protein
MDRSGSALIAMHGLVTITRVANGATRLSEVKTAPQEKAVSPIDDEDLVLTESGVRDYAEQLLRDENRESANNAAKFGCPISVS